jgi:hypothetical protein
MPTMKRWMTLGRVITGFSIILFVPLLITSRTNRLQEVDSTFFSGLFVGLLGISAVLIAGLLWFMWNQQIITTLQQRTWAWAAWFGSFMLVLIGVLLIPNIIPYRLPYLLLIVGTAIGTTLMIAAPQISKLPLRSILMGIIGLCLSIAVTLLIIEIGLRAYFGLVASEPDRVAYYYSVDEILARSNRYIGIPYVNYALSPGHIEHNSRGYRGAELREDSTYRIFALGGSTTYGAGVTPQEAYPAQLDSILHAEYGHSEIEVVNAGVNAYSSYDSLANLAFRVLDDRPDMLIIYHGINDVVARLTDPRAYSGNNLQRGIWSPQTLQDAIGSSVLSRFIRIQLGLLENPLYFETLLLGNSPVKRCLLFESICADLDNQSAADVLSQNPPIYLERNLRNIVAIARANGVEVVFSTWASYAGETPLPNPIQQQHIQDALSEQNQLVLDLGAELGVPVIDFAAQAPQGELYWQDGMHLTAPGTLEQARQYAEFLVNNDLLE